MVLSSNDFFFNSELFLDAFPGYTQRQAKCANISYGKNLPFDLFNLLLLSGKTIIDAMAGNK